MVFHHDASLARRRMKIEGIIVLATNKTNKNFFFKPIHMFFIVRFVRCHYLGEFVLAWQLNDYFLCEHFGIFTNLDIIIYIFKDI